MVFKIVFVLRSRLLARYLLKYHLEVSFYFQELQLEEEYYWLNQMELFFLEEELRDVKVKKPKLLN